MGVENDVTSCDLRVFVDESAESIMPQDSDAARWMRTILPVRWSLSEAAMRPVDVVMIDVLGENPSQVTVVR